MGFSFRNLFPEKEGGESEAGLEHERREPGQNEQDEGSFENGVAHDEERPRPGSPPGRFADGHREQRTGHERPGESNGEG